MPVGNIRNWEALAPVPDWHVPSGNNLIFSVFPAVYANRGITLFLRYSWLACAIREWRGSNSWMG
jgi:hypothetical protein